MFGFLRGNFPNPELADPTQPKQQKKITRPGSKIFDLDPSLVEMDYIFVVNFWAVKVTKEAEK